MKILNLFLVMITGAFLVYGTIDMPNWGDPNSYASLHVSPGYIQNTISDTATPNIVTSVLADYRGYDTLGETAVVFTAGAACILLLRKIQEKRGKQHD